MSKSVLSILFILFSCSNVQVEKNVPVEDKNAEVLVKVNRYLIKRDVGLIKAYIKRHNWKMQQSESGLWFEVLESGNKERIKKNEKVVLKYRTELLDGTLCYSSDSTGNKQFSAGAGQVENGLDEGILLLGKGAKARFIIPSHLAYGLLGDEKKIPARAIIVYHVEVLDVKN